MGTSTRDIHIFESGSGGDAAILSGDLVLSESLFKTIYIALFGGNIEASTIGDEIAGEERNDYWANDLIFRYVPNKQFNSATERALSSVALNSSGRIQIEAAVHADLAFLQQIVDVEVNAVILSTDKLQINIRVTNTTQQVDKQLQLIWNNAKQEIIIDKTI